jgi:hypothetical protein
MGAKGHCDISLAAPPFYPVHARSANWPRFGHVFAALTGRWGVSNDSGTMSDRTEQQPTKPSDMLEPVHAGKKAGGTWTEYLVLFLRLMAAVSLIKGLYHWAQVCGIGADPDDGFLAHTMAWRAATVFFAVLDLVAAVGLWLAAAWGAVVWLSSVVSMAVVEVFFPNVYGGSMFVVLVEVTLLGIYLWLAIVSAREHPA